jgi:hypothetical protein
MQADTCVTACAEGHEAAIIPNRERTLTPVFARIHPLDPVSGWLPSILLI